LFEDEYLAIIHKPAGIEVSGNSFKTIDRALGQNLNPSVLADASTPHPAHRIDYATTGVLLIGKTSSSISALNALFENKEIKKIYFAITIGAMHPKGTIQSNIDGKECLSKYKVNESVGSERFKRLNLVKLKPKTGRRHQLRKHLSSIGNPILGDKNYGIEGLILMGKGMYLHAYSLEFIHPYTNQEVYFKSELPKSFEKIFPTPSS
jgi:23S rRNA pseudouridine1911/1915/1917 synthase